MSRERIEAVLGRVRPFLRSDGGDIELVDVVGSRARIRLTGKCAGCPSAPLTLFFGVEHAIREEMPDLDAIELV